MSMASTILAMIANQPEKMIRGPFDLSITNKMATEVDCELVYMAKVYVGKIGYDDMGATWSFTPMLTVEEGDEDEWLDFVFEVIGKFGLNAESPS